MRESSYIPYPISLEIDAEGGAEEQPGSELQHVVPFPLTFRAEPPQFCAVTCLESASDFNASPPKSAAFRR